MNVEAMAEQVKVLCETPDTRPLSVRMREVGGYGMSNRFVAEVEDLEKRLAMYRGLLQEYRASKERVELLETRLTARTTTLRETNQTFEVYKQRVNVLTEDNETLKQRCAILEKLNAILEKLNAVLVDDNELITEVNASLADRVAELEALQGCET